MSHDLPPKAMNEDPTSQRNLLRVLAWQEMSELTQPKCASCTWALPDQRCCEPVYCEAAQRWAKDRWGVELTPTDHPSLPFMGPNGCTVPPHLRPICTVHVCERHYITDGEFGQRYFDLRARIDALEQGAQFDEASPECKET